MDFVAVLLAFMFGIFALTLAGVTLSQMDFSRQAIYCFLARLFLKPREVKKFYGLDAFVFKRLVKGGKAVMLVCYNYDLSCEKKVTAVAVIKGFYDSNEWLHCRGWIYYRHSKTFDYRQLYWFDTSDGYSYLPQLPHPPDWYLLAEIVSGCVARNSDDGKIKRLIIFGLKFARK